MSSVVLKKASDSFIKRKHPWIFSGAIEKVEGNPSNGETVQIFTSNKTLVGKGSFSPSSQIRVRVWSINPEEKIDEDFFRRKIMLALEIRKQIIDTSASRGVVSPLVDRRTVRCGRAGGRPRPVPPAVAMNSHREP